MLLLTRLLNDADGPLYEGRATTTIAAALEEIAANLDDTG
jgi:hypothetical protein